MSFLGAEVEETGQGKKEDGEIVREHERQGRPADKEITAGEEAEGAEGAVEGTRVGGENSRDHEKPVQGSRSRPGDDGQGGGESPEGKPDYELNRGPLGQNRFKTAHFFPFEGESRLNSPGSAITGTIEGVS